MPVKLANLVGGDTLSTSSTSNRFALFGAGNHTSLGTGVITVSMPWRQAGVFSNLRVFLSANTFSGGRTATITLQKNGSDQTSQVTIPNAATGWFEDVTNTDAVSAAGDLYQYRIVCVGGLGAMSIRFIQLAFAPTDQTIWYDRLQGYAIITVDAATTGYLPIPSSADFTATATEALTQNRAARAMTLQHLCVRLIVGLVGTNTWRTRINGSDGNGLITVPASATGVFEDTSNTDALAVGDLYNVSFTNSGGVGQDLGWLGAALKSTGGIAFCGQRNSGGITQTANLIAYAVPWAISLIQLTTEPTTQAGIYSGAAVALGLTVTANSLTHETAVRAIKNGVDTPLAVTVPASTTGTFENTTDRVGVVFADTLIYKITSLPGGTSMTYTRMWGAYDAGAGTGVLPNVALYVGGQFPVPRYRRL